MKKSRKKPFKPLLFPLAGAHRSVIRQLEKEFVVDRKYYLKWTLTKAVSALSTYLSIRDRKKWSRSPAIEAGAPLFIIGHWRSGTTFLHNLLCQGNRSYTSTYQGVFPNNVFAFKWLFKTFMRLTMPAERPADGVAIDPDYPQEEEIGLGNEFYHSYYYWFHFPRNHKEIARRFLLDPDDKARSNWKEHYGRFVNRCLANVPGKYFISKNPPNTCRIKDILELYPDARFIFIHRDPYEVFLSCRRFFWATLQGIQAQEIAMEAFEEDLLQVHAALLERYDKDRSLIPADHLVEVSYSELINAPTETIQKVNNKLNLSYDEMELKKIEEYISAQNRHRKSSYEFQEVDIAKVNNHWTSSLERLGYEKRSST